MLAGRASQHSVSGVPNRWRSARFLLVILGGLAILMLGSVSALASPVGAVAPESNSLPCSYDNFGDVSLTQPSRNVDLLLAMSARQMALQRGTRHFPTQSDPSTSNPSALLPQAGLLAERLQFERPLELEPAETSLLLTTRLTE